MGNIAGTESRTHDLLACGVVPAYLTSNNVILPYWFVLILIQSGAAIHGGSR